MPSEVVVARHIAIFKAEVVRLAQVDDLADDLSTRRAWAVVRPRGTVSEARLAELRAPLPLAEARVLP